MYLQTKEGVWYVIDDSHPATATHVFAFPVGGGFVKRIPHDHVALRQEQAPVFDAREPALFCFDCAPPIFVGVHDPRDNWNGFAKPVLNRESVERLLRWLCQCDGNSYTVTDDGVYTLTQADYDDTAILTPGEHGYNMSALGLTFDAVTVAELATYWADDENTGIPEGLPAEMAEDFQRELAAVRGA